MRIRLVVDGEKQELEVDLAKGEARLGGREVPFRVLEEKGPRVEIEVGGERHLLEGWPVGATDEAPRTLVVNREMYRLEVQEVEAPVVGSTPVPSASSSAGRSAPGGPSSRAPLPAAAGGAGGASGPGVAITPPMPGKVLEVRVHEGESVVVGQTLLVLEAMKMRNEVQSPAPGKVAGLTAVAGSTVKAREVLLRIVPA